MRGRAWILGALGLVAGLSATGMVLLADDRVPTAIGRFLLKRLHERLPVDVTFDRLTVSLWTNTVRLTGARLYLPDRRAPLAAVDELRFRPDWGTLLRERRLRLHDLWLTGPTGILIHFGKGRYNVSPFLGGAGGGKPGAMPVEFGAVHVTRARMAYLDRERQLAIGLGDISAEVVGTAKRHVTVTAWAGDGWARLRQRQRPVKGHVTLRLDDRDLTLTELAGDLGAFSLRARGTLTALGASDARMRLAADVSTELDRWPAVRQVAFAGRGHVRLMATGPARAPFVAMAFTGAGLRAGPLAIGDVTGRLWGRWMSQELALGRFEADVLGGRVRGTGSATVLGDTPALLARGTFAGLRLARMAALVGRPGLATGTADGAWRFGFSGDDARRLDGGLTVAARGALAAVPGGPRGATPVTAGADVTLSRQAIEVRSASARLGGAVFSAEGRLAFAGASTLRFTGRVPEVATVASRFGLTRLSGGPIALAGRVRGGLHAARLEARTAIGPLRWGRRELVRQGRLEVAAALGDALRVRGAYVGRGLIGRDGEVRAPFGYDATLKRPLAGTIALTGFTARVEGGRAWADGRWTLGPRLPGRLTSRYEAFATEALWALTPAALQGRLSPPSEASVTGTLAASGPFSRPLKLRADVAVSRLRVAFPNFAVANEGPIRLAWRPAGQAEVAMHLVGPTTDVRVAGALGPRIPGGVTLDGRLDLGFLRAFPRLFPGAAGGVAFNGRLTGFPGRGDLQGRLAVRDGRFSTRALAQSVRDLTADVHVAGDRVVLERFHAALGLTGAMDAAAQVKLGPGLRPEWGAGWLQVPAIALSAEGVRALARAEFAGAIRHGAARIDGRVELLEGRWTREPDAVYRFLSRDGGRPAAPLLPTWPWLDQVALRVEVAAPGSVRVRTVMLDGVATADLSVVGTLAHPVLVGRAGMGPGARLRLHGQPFDLDAAEVSFLDPRRNRPYLNFGATTRVGQYDVRVQALGEPGALRVDYASTPYLPPNDVRVLLATGRTPADLARRGEGVSVLTGFAIDQAALGLASAIAGPGALDLVRLAPASRDDAAPRAGFLSLGKRLNERLMVGFSADWAVPGGKSPGQLLWANYDVSDTLELAIAQELAGGTAASARYRVMSW